MDRLMLIIGKLWSYIFPKKINKTSGIKNLLYTGYYSRRFKSFGKGSKIVCSQQTFVGTNNIEVGRNVFIGQSCHLVAIRKNNGEAYTSSITIGDDTRVGNFTRMFAASGIHLGKGVRLGDFVLMTDNSHGNSTLEDVKIPPNKRRLHSKGTIEIEDNVWIGDKVSITSSVHIGYGAIIAANSVVTKDIPPYCVAAGIPAKVIKEME